MFIVTVAKSILIPQRTNLLLGKKFVLSPQKIIKQNEVSKIKEFICIIKGSSKGNKKLAVKLTEEICSKFNVEKLKETIFCLTRLFLCQCQVYIGQRLRICVQLYSSYSRILGETVTRKRFSGLRKRLLNKNKSFLLSAPCIFSFKKENILSDLKLESASKEYDCTESLCTSTVFCDSCNKRLVIDQKVNGIDYCVCEGKNGYSVHQYELWEPFLERENILVWRKKHDYFPHLYCYKVYGKYDDISSAAFMEAQLNTDYRTCWDTTALELKVLSSDSVTHSDLIYWVVKFPQFFANRDYVYNRRFKINEKRKEVVILNEASAQSILPEVQGIHRVNDYWAAMVIRANEDFHTPGLTYTLTYFDNPGMSLPTAITNYVACKAFPDFLGKVHTAARNLQIRWQNGEDVYATLPESLRYPSKPALDSTRKEMLPGETLTGRSDVALSPNDATHTSKIDLEALEVIPAAEVSPNKLLKLINGDLFRNRLSEKLKVFRERLERYHRHIEKAGPSRFLETKRRDYYDEDESEGKVLQLLFVTMREVLQTNKDLKTGKLMIRDTPECSIENKAKEISRDDINVNCPCCDCQHCLKEDKTNSWFYWMPNLRWSNKENILYESQCSVCAKVHPNCSTTEPPSEIDAENIFLNNQTVSKVNADNVDDIKMNRTTVSWYWMPIQGSLDAISWLLSFWMSKSV